MRLNMKKEPNAKAWMLRAMIGPASLLDGVIATVTLGFVSTEFTLATARALALVRIESSNDRGQRGAACGASAAPTGCASNGSTE